MRYSSTVGANANSSSSRSGFALACACCVLVAMSGCGDKDTQPGASGPSVNADGTLNLSQHREKIMGIMNNSLALIQVFSQDGIIPTIDATEEQKATLKRVASHQAIGEVKDPVIEFDIWMDQLSADQAKELDQRLDALQAWIDEMQACYPFTEGSQLANVKARVELIEKHVQAIKADLPD